MHSHNHVFFTYFVPRLRYDKKTVFNYLQLRY